MRPDQIAPDCPPCVQTACDVAPGLLDQILGSIVPALAPLVVIALVAAFVAWGVTEIVRAFVYRHGPPKSEAWAWAFRACAVLVGTAAGWVLQHDAYGAFSGFAAGVLCTAIVKVAKSKIAGAGAQAIVPAGAGDP